MQDRGLIAIQFWRGDKDKAMRLARLIADMEPAFNRQVDFLFVARFDIPHDPVTVKHVSRKFEVRTYTTKARSVGHPWGSWCLWFSTVEWFAQLKGKKIPDYKWIFPFEADCVPISRTWIDDISREWDASRGVYLLGSETFHWRQHLNGNLMVSGDPQFLTWLTKGVGIRGCPPKDAWDIYLFPQFARWGVGFSKRIKNVCGQPTCSREEFERWRAEGLSFIHGVKDHSLYDHARAAFTNS